MSTNQINTNYCCNCKYADFTKAFRDKAICYANPPVIGNSGSTRPVVNEQDIACRFFVETLSFGPLSFQREGGAA